MTAQQEKGLLLAMGTAVISGVAVFANGLVVKGIDPLVHTTVKNVMVGIIVVGLLLGTGRWRETRRLSRKQGLRLGLIALVGGSISFALFFAGLKIIGAASGALIHKTLVIWVALLAVPLLKEKVSLKMMVGIGLLYGASFLAGGEIKSVGLGHMMVLGATLLWAVENVMAKKVLDGVSPDLVVAARMGGGAVILMGMTLLSGKLPLVYMLTGQQWLMLLGVAILLFGYVATWYRALKYLPATLTASVLVGATVITSLLQSLLITKALSFETVGQSVLIVTGIYVVIMAGMDIWRKAESQKRIRVV
jgi:drug/metabolite transporter (DMT)-like permease